MDIRLSENFVYDVVAHFFVHDVVALNIYKLRWDIEKFFSWWKQHLNVYHVIARSPYGLMAQILGGLITYLLLAIYCHEEHKERVSITRVRELRIKIRNELAEMLSEFNDSEEIDESLLATGPPSHASP